MGGNYSHTNRADGTVLTASIYNADHQNHINNATPQGLDDYSIDVSEMQKTTDPGENGSESRPTSLAGELERLRFAIAEMKGTQYWYESARMNLMSNANHVIVNGDIRIWQRGNSFTGISATSNTLLADYWRFIGDTNNGVVDVIRDNSDYPAISSSGVYISTSLKATVTTADNTGNNAIRTAVSYTMPGDDWRMIAHKEFTLGFWVKSSKAGKYAVAFFNGTSGSDGRSYWSSYTINQANTWEYKTVTIPAAPTSGVWAYAGGLGLDIRWMLSVGSNWQSGSENTWNTNEVLGDNSLVNWLDAIGNTFLLTGVTLTLGTVAVPFESMPREDRNDRLQSYFQKSYNPNIRPGTVDTINSPFRVKATGLNSAAHMVGVFVPYISKLSTVNTFTTYSPNTGASGMVRDNVNNTDVAATVTTVGKAGAFVEMTQSAAATSYDFSFQWTAEGGITSGV